MVGEYGGSRFFVMDGIDCGTTNGWISALPAVIDEIGISAL